MPVEKTEGVVVRAVDYSETSRIVTFITPARGRLAGIAKGARRKNSAWSGLFETFNRLEILYYWKGSRAVQPLSEATVIDRFPALRVDVAKSSYAAWTLEVASNAVHENEPADAMYDALVNGLSGLADWSADARTHACWQVMQLLAAAGYAPSLDRCVDTGEAASNARGFRLEGGVTRDAPTADRQLRDGDLATLRRLTEAADACPTVEVDTALYRLIVAYASHQLSTDFRSTRVIDAMYGGEAVNRH